MWITGMASVLFVLRISLVTSKVGIEALSSSSAKTKSSHHYRHQNFKKPIFHHHRQRDPVDVERHLIRSHGFTHIIGCDESGSGCLAGPVVVASCAILNHSSYKPILGVDDGKRLSASDRERIFDHLTARRHSHLYQWSIVIRSNQQIDDSPSVLESTIGAFQESIESLVVRLPASRNVYCIVDGHKAPKPQDVGLGVSVPCRPWPRGDSAVYTVALASILARITRERIINLLHIQYPEYGWKSANGGYPSKEHLLALHRHGPSPYHRRSCKPVKQVLSRRNPL